MSRKICWKKQSTKAYESTIMDLHYFGIASFGRDIDHSILRRPK